mmetsp:Transcript_29506/g.73069  ORF Transcript_29506/g.73069 Transcript_29506/m.73069 type:complete len:285 (+) Transcript_29506:499-1353(+)
MTFTPRASGLPPSSKSFVSVWLRSAARSFTSLCATARTTSFSSWNLPGSTPCSSGLPAGASATALHTALPHTSAWTRTSRVCTLSFPPRAPQFSTYRAASSFLEVSSYTTLSTRPPRAACDSKAQNCFSSGGATLAMAAVSWYAPCLRAAMDAPSLREVSCRSSDARARFRVKPARRFCPSLSIDSARCFRLMFSFSSSSMLARLSAACVPRRACEASSSSPDATMLACTVARFPSRTPFFSPKMMFFSSRMPIFLPNSACSASCLFVDSDVNAFFTPVVAASA